MNLTTKTIDQVRDDINDLLQPIAEKYGLKELIIAPGGKWDPTNASFELKIKGIAEGGKSQEEADYETERTLFNKDLPPLKTIIVFQGQFYSVEGWARKSVKYPVLVKRTSDGQGFKLTVNAVINSTKQSPK